MKLSFFVILAYIIQQILRPCNIFVTIKVRCTFVINIFLIYCIHTVEPKRVQIGSLPCLFVYVFVVPFRKWQSRSIIQPYEIVGNGWSHCINRFWK